MPPGATSDVPADRFPADSGASAPCEGVVNIVLVDDDNLYREALSADLADRGFAVSCFADGPSFLAALDSGIAAEAVLLDWFLPQESGLELLGALRERGIDLPVIFLTGYSVPERELQALHQGAVDFVDKARGVDVVARRLRVIVEGRARPAAESAPPAERHGELALHPSTLRALWRERDVGLTVTEYRIVSLLVAHEGEVLTYRALYDAAHYEGFVAGSGERGYHTNVRSMVKRIRRKFIAVDAEFSEIENKAHAGYRWRAGPGEGSGR
jgi:two-component system, OmpR family, response regulator ChvI